MIKIVYLQGFNGGASTGSFADNLCIALAELEMLVPILRSRIKEFDGFAREIINGFSFCGFVRVTFAADEPKIFFGGFAAQRLRENVFNF